MFKLFKYSIVLILVLGGLFYWTYQKNIYRPAGSQQETVSFVVNKGDNIKTISKRLADQSLIKSDFFFNLYVWQKKLGKDFKAGEYELSPGMNTVEIVERLNSGKVVSREREIKIIEGWSIEEIDEYLTKEGVLPDNVFAQTAAGKQNFLIHNSQFLIPGYEGYLFPDTYKIFKDAGPDDIIKKMTENFRKKLTPDMLADINKQGRTLPEIITMASIIEKEVRGEKDMAVVSGILWKRISIGQALQVDSSVNYLTKSGRPGATYEELQIDSPYNTYKYKGLPPGPISNPGLAAIKAAIYPEASPYLYYLNRQDTGETIWGRTYDEHLANKRKYLR